MEAALAGAAVKAVLGAVLKNLLAQALQLVEKRRKLLKEFPTDLESIHTELCFIYEEMEGIPGIGDPSTVRSASMDEMRDLAHDIEDCLDRILRSTEGRKMEASVQYAKQVKELIVKLKEAHQRRINYRVSDAQAQPSSATLSIAADLYKLCSSPSFVGMEEPKNQIVSGVLTDDSEEGQSEKPKVISIVGFSGSGKTTIAEKVFYDEDVEKQFPCRAWVAASEHGNDTKALLMVLFGKFYPEEQAGGDVKQLQIKISSYLSKQRYLIILDDIKEENLWHGIKSTFSKNNRSRIIVTTTTLSIAKVCSSGNGYVHNLKTLDDKQSKELLISFLPEHSFSLGQSSTSVVNKCDGHPLSLCTVARYLEREDVITEEVCEQLSHRLGRRVATEDAFLMLREVLMKNYTSLPGHLPNIKACLMYMCVFPNDFYIKRSRLTRRWLAEHYVQYEHLVSNLKDEDKHADTTLEVADEYIKKLVDRNIISAIGARKNPAVVKSCRAHGIVHEFMMHMSQSAKFITSLGDPKRRDYRHLFRDGRLSASSGRCGYKDKKIFGFSISSSKGKEKAKEEHKFRAHSLTICGNAGEAIGEFLNCELLRVLDLEDCDDVKNEDIDRIHELWHLKYLSLGATISRLPKDIEKLYCLETLDVRKTKKEITLPVVVLKLPRLAHLLGKFNLEKNWKKGKTDKYVIEESNLHMLAGFVTDDDPGFPMLMSSMKKLQKVKAWCNSYSEELLDAIKKFVQIGLPSCDGPYSLSLCLGTDVTRNFLCSLQSALENSYGYLRCLKIHGALGTMDSLTELTTFLFGLKELCLSSTDGSAINDNDLSNLSQLKCLEHIKLVKVSLGGLTIRRWHFPKLLCLCLVQSPALPAIETGALKILVSLQLLSEDLGNLSGIKIEQHKLLQEVVLDSRVSEGTKTILEDAAQKHPKRPRVLYLDRVDPDETGSTVKYVAAKRPAPKTISSVVQEEHQIRVHEDTKAIQEDAAQKHPKRPRGLYCDIIDPDETGSKRLAPETRSLAAQEDLSFALEQATISDELRSSRDTQMPSSSRIVS